MPPTRYNGKSTATSARSFRGTVTETPRPDGAEMAIVTCRARHMNHMTKYVRFQVIAYRDTFCLLWNA
jgi:hypothetical protein